VIFKDRLYLI